MKIRAVLFLIALGFVGCRSSQIEQVSENQKSAVVESDTARLNKLNLLAFSINDLAEDKRREFDKILPPKVRTFLETSEELKITVGSNLSNNRKIVSLRDEKLKADLLRAFYSDVADSIPTGKNVTHFACVSPNHSIKTENENGKAEIEISYNCSNFYLKGDFGNTTGFIKRNGAKALEVFDEIVSKYID